MATAVVVDNGSCLIKAGFSGDEKPSVVCSSLVGRAKQQQTKPEILGASCKEVYLGSEISADNRCFLNLTQTVRNGFVQNWDDMEMIFSNLFYHELRIKTEDHPFMLVEHALNPMYYSEKMMQLMFETFLVPKYFAKTSGALILYSSGRYSGVACDVGHDVTTITPIYNGYSFYNAIKRVHMGGNNITQQLEKLLMIEKGYYTESSSDHEVCRMIKEKCCMVLPNYSEVVKSIMTPHAKDFIKTDEYAQIYTLPDGSSLTLDTERFRASEVLFNPQLIGREVRGISDLISDSVEACDRDARNDLFQNVILSGGTVQMEGFIDRVGADLQRLGHQVTIDTTDTENKYNSPFIGGSILCCMSSFEDSWISRDEYNECGSYALIRRRYNQYYY